jgi:regulator of protease activity HflC (stomatin/prohibitin superfamily)
MLGNLLVFAVIALAIFVLITSAIKVVQEYERGVIFRLGRVVGVKGPGIIFLIPFIDRMVKVDLRTITLDIPSQEAITRDNVTVKVNAVAYFRVIDPERSVVAVEDYRKATWQIAQTSLRSVLGQSDLDELLIRRDEINQKLQKIIDEQTEPWGIKVSIVEVKDVELPDSLKRAMARQAEAEREKRSKIIHAEGELVASVKLTEAANVMAQQPIAIQLRYLQTLNEIAAERNSTIVFPLPMNLMGSLERIAEKLAGNTSAAADEPKE